ncbi:MAG: DRTGG domain-containing protein [Roseburia sp.]|nr:DRTGG domain-containing protein [Roseburia sp.]
MKIAEVAQILNAEVLCCGDLAENTEVHSACGSDMMSDVLAYVKDQGLLLSGLCNPQVVRTAEMMDIVCIAFVRGKRPDKSVIELAESKGIILLSTDYRMYLACGLLYRAGLDAGKAI